MFSLNKEKPQGEVVFTIETKEWHLTTEDGLEFIVLEEDAWEWVKYRTNLSEDYKSVDSFRDLSFGDPIIKFMNGVEDLLSEME